ncbi:hypothetical protein EDD15DRAFT_2287858 [Pisolithus albus]|nr:hypothetical protein EDD15DRAFT_2287858 [Pisolithus albus]
MAVLRKRLEKARTTTRVAETFVRIGNFETLSPSRAMVFYSGIPTEALRILGEWTVMRVPNTNLDAGDAWGKELVVEVARRNKMQVAAWLAYGFMHGVINMDKQLSKSILHREAI